MSEDYLIHYGKLGMKWGVRHDPVRKSSGSRTSKSSKKSNQNTFSSLKSKAQKVLSKINKQKVKKVLKVGAIAAGVAVAGTIGGIAVSTLLSTSVDFSSHPTGVSSSLPSKLKNTTSDRFINSDEWLRPRKPTTIGESFLTEAQRRKLERINPKNPYATYLSR